MNLGKAIKLCRTQRGLNQSELASIAGISVSYLSLLERGKRDAPFSTVEALACALTIPIVILIFLATDDNETAGLDAILREKLSHAALQLLSEKGSK